MLGAAGGSRDPSLHQLGEARHAPKFVLRTEVAHGKLSQDGQPRRAVQSRLLTLIIGTALQDGEP